MFEQFILNQNFIFSASLLKAHHFLLPSALHFLLIHHSPIVTNLPHPLPNFGSHIWVHKPHFLSLSLSVLYYLAPFHWISVLLCFSTRNISLREL